MSRNADILDELKALQSPLAEGGTVLPYAVPDGYFNGLAETLTAGVHAAETEDPAADQLPRSLPFQTPEFYFEKLAERLAATAHKADVTEIKAIPFEVPAGYLENLPVQLLHAVRSQEAMRTRKAKSIAFVPAWRRWASVAAAAVLLLMFSLGGYRYYETHTPEALADRQLSQLDKESISVYVEQHLDEFDAMALEGLAAALPAAEMGLPALDENEIQQYLEESGDLPQKEDASTL